MHRICLAFFLVLAACGTKGEVSTVGDAASSIVSGQGQRLTENVSAPGPRHRIACESFRTIGFTHSFSSNEDRDLRSLELSDGESVAPVLLSASRERVDVLHVEKSYYPSLDLKVLVSQYGLKTRREGKRLELLKIPALPEAATYTTLGLGHPKIAALSPDRFLFAVRDGKGYSVRRTALPLDEVAHWDLEFVNPRWERANGDAQDMLFTDTVEAGRISQSMLRLNEEGGIASMEQLPAPALDAKAHQLGLRRFSDTQVLWLEWSNGKALFRLMDLASRKTFELAVPDSVPFGAGYALHLMENGARSFVLQTREDLRFYRLDRGKLLFVSSLPYSKASLEKIAADHSWKPGQIFSDARELQLFVVLPEMWGTHLFAVDGAESFRRFGYQRCVNPSFLEER